MRVLMTGDMMAAAASAFWYSRRAALGRLSLLNRSPNRVKSAALLDTASLSASMSSTCRSLPSGWRLSRGRNTANPSIRLSLCRLTCLSQAAWNPSTSTPMTRRRAWSGDCPSRSASSMSRSPRRPLSRTIMLTMLLTCANASEASRPSSFANVGCIFSKLTNAFVSTASASRLAERGVRRLA